ncbi:hypothetical protein [Acuticoccus sp.]|uniref:hypothetical protein n=1 Tax=Acuticoccus sp. TaxID=1904378 RepID=UPI003B521F4E
MRVLVAGIVSILMCGSAIAADLASEPVKRTLFGRCSYLNNIWLFGDPTDCPGDETVPACDAKSVVSAAVRFANRAEPVYREPRVAEFLPVREVHDTLFNPSPLVRRYCVGTVRLSNGDLAQAHYFVEEDSDFVSLSWSVYVCIDGYDPWRVYDGRCRVARPSPRH